MKEAIHLSLQSVEGAPQPRRHVEVGTCNLGHSSDEQPAVGAGEKQRRPKAEVGDEVAVGTRDAFDQAVQAQPSEVVAHLALGHGAGRESERLSEELSQVMVGEPVGRQDMEHHQADSNAWVTG